MKWELLIQNVQIADGSGGKLFEGDVAVAEGKIAAVGPGLPAQESRRVLDGGAKVLAPGFIDSHSHEDLRILAFPEQKDKIEQGVTTNIAGMCGLSPAPAARAAVQENRRLGLKDYEGGSTEDYLSTAAFFQAIENRKICGNIALFVGQGAIREKVMGMSAAAPEPEQLEEMQELVRQAMAEGALGISSGLIYPPGSYTETEELIRLCQAAALSGGLYSTHIRSEGDGLIPAVEEALEIAQKAEIRTILSHHKATRPQNWGKTKKTLELVEQANSQGSDVYLDVYPYTASSTGLTSRIPDCFHAGGRESLIRMLQSPTERQVIRQAMIREGKTLEDFGRDMIGQSQAFPEYTGLRLPEAAERHGKDCFDTLFDILAADRLATKGIFFTMNEEDVERVLQYPRTMIGSDGLPAGEGGFCHPRTYGTFPRILAEYVRKRKVLRLEEAIRRMTGLPAQVYGLTHKGRIAPGMDADLVLFDPETIQDHADYKHCDAPCTGMIWVMVAGKILAEDGAWNGERAGRLLRRRCNPPGTAV